MGKQLRWMGLVAAVGLVALVARAGEAVAIPFGGNAFATGAAISPAGRDAGSWSDKEVMISFFFRVDRAVEMELALRGRVPTGESEIRVEAAGRRFEAKWRGGEMNEVRLGRIRPEAPGYVRVDLHGLAREGPVFAEIESLLVVPADPEARLHFVRENRDGRFYWGRRGPSVHLSYRVPEERAIEWFYSEITVPEGGDPIGSYFMANGFGEGYFGIQVNGPEERRVLFSVWSPYPTDNPREIPEDQRVTLLGKGEGVRTGEFGNEGSGGQSFLVYPWKTGETYRFLNRARPDDRDGTVYTAWFFAPEEGRWRLVASFRRPKTVKHLTGIHSFLENFNNRNGWRERRAFFGNSWARDTEGDWHCLTEARFTGDDIARRGYRLDYAGGAAGERFWMRNGGFFNEVVALDSDFTRKPGVSGEPRIDLKMLEGY